MLRQVGLWAADGSCLQGYATARYEELVRLFGEPHKHGPEGDGKVQVSWVLQEPTGGIVVTIYDWKRYREDPKNITVWEVGGRSRLAVDLLRLNGLSTVYL